MSPSALSQQRRRRIRKSGPAAFSDPACGEQSAGHHGDGGGLRNRRQIAVELEVADNGAELELQFDIARMAGGEIWGDLEQWILGSRGIEEARDVIWLGDDVA